MSKVKVQVQFCGGWGKNLMLSLLLIEVAWRHYSCHSPSLVVIIGYTRNFLLLQDFLSKQEFADKIEIVGKKDPGNTGNFEVTIGDEGQLIHSKRTAGQGKANTDAEKAAIVELIQEYLDDNL